MSVQPKHHWQFTKQSGSTLLDSAGGVKAKLSNTQLIGHGRIGHAIKINGKTRDSRIDMGNQVAHFGTQDFTVAFGMKVIDTFKQDRLHVIGNRSTSGHGNFFSLRLQNGGQLRFEVDEDSRGKNYATLASKRVLTDGKWHHIAAVRQGRSLKLYIDGDLSDESQSKKGIANIVTRANLLLGARGLKTAVAQYEDLRIYHSALNAADVKALVPGLNRPLGDKEIELIGTDDSAIILSEDESDLGQYSTTFKTMRVGRNALATLYQNKSFRGASQKCFADLPDIRLSKLKKFPGSVRIKSSVGEPFTGKWIINAPDGQYLSMDKLAFGTVSTRSEKELFKIHRVGRSSRMQLANAAFTAVVNSASNAAVLRRFKKLNTQLKATSLFIDDTDSLDGKFLIVNQANDEWLKLADANKLEWTRNRDEGALFERGAKMADSEAQVGELSSGEVAFYEHIAYNGKTWILSDSNRQRPGEIKNFTSFQSLNDQTSSILLGPDTGVTLFKHSNFKVNKGKKEEEVEDLLESNPDLRESQIGNDALSSVKIFRTVSSENLFRSFTSKLSQDYRMVNNQLEEFSAYRTTLRFNPGSDNVEVSATDLTTIEVDGNTHVIDETRSVTLSPNNMNFIMITSEADGLDTPGLKFRNKKMARNEQVVIFPNVEAQQQIANFEEGALWNAKDAKGKLIIDRDEHSKEEVANVQNTLKRMMSTVVQTDAAPLARTSRSAKAPQISRIASRLTPVDTQVVSAAAIGNPWELKLKPTRKKPGQIAARSRSRSADFAQRAVNSTAPTAFKEVELDQRAFTRLLEQAKPSQLPDDARASVLPSIKAPSVGRIAPGRASFRIPTQKIFKPLKDAFNDATSVIVGVVDDVVHVLVETGKGIIDFVVDTAQKVAEFVEAVVDQVVSSIKQFIEFLQFLFDWKDILATQRYLVSAINAGFDFTAQNIEAAKTPVASFIDGLQDSVEQGMNDLIRGLGSNPSPARESGFELPEAAEWFFSKMMGGSKEKGADTEPDVDTISNTGSELDAFHNHFLEAFDDVGGAVKRQFEGVGETIEALIKNPLKPKVAVATLVETLRDVILQAMEAVQHGVLGMMDILVEVIEQFKKLLNAEIRIPFISDLFKMIGGGKLTLMNLTALLLAIPLTVLSKLLFKRAPFKDTASTDLFRPARTRSLTRSETFEADTTADGGNSRLENQVKDWGIAGLTADALNGLINAGLDSIPEVPEDEQQPNVAGSAFETISILLGGISWLASFPSSPDVPGGRPYNFLAETVTSDDRQVRAERAMWGWRTGMFFIDVVYIIGSYARITQKPGNVQRIRRGNEVTIAVHTLLSTVDMIFTIKYLFTIPKKDKPGFEITNEIVALVPNLMAPLRMSGPQSALALSVLDFIAMVINTGIGAKLLNDDLDDLRSKDVAQPGELELAV